MIEKSLPQLSPEEMIQQAEEISQLLKSSDPQILEVIKLLDMEKINKALEYILHHPSLSDARKRDLLENSWKLNYKSKPPTPQEFLTYKYIGGMVETLYPRVQKWFLDFFDETKPHRNAVLYPFIGAGKSTLAVLINLYITVHLALMRDPKKLFNLAVTTRLAFVLFSYNLEKAAEVLLEPFIALLENSEFFERCRTKEDMIRKEAEFKRQTGEVNKIYWTTASRNGIYALQFSNGINYKLASSPKDILGLTIVCGTMTELAFFRDAGKSDEYIMRSFNDMKNRVWSRMKNTEISRYWGRTILDSSPNVLESPIDAYCMFDAEKDEKNYVVKGSHWQWVPEDYEPGELEDVFPIFRGGSGKPARILTNTEGIDITDIIWVPKYQKGISMYQMFVDDLVKSLKDLAGIPQGNLDKLFYDYDRIEQCFVPNLRSVNYAMKADSRMSPFGLIWSQLRDDFFVKSGSAYKFYYKPKIPRVFHIDQSISNDMTAIAFVHVERKEDSSGTSDAGRDMVYVVDLVVPIHPMGGRINLDAIKEFVKDVYMKGGISIIAGSYDTFQSESSIQDLLRTGIEVEHLSVDETMDPYIFLSQLIEQGNLKLGRNIFFKNNLKSLRITQTKIAKKLKVDHTNGDTVDPTTADHNWETSLMGINAKDVSDAIAGAVYLAKLKLAQDGRSLAQVWREDNVVVTPEKIKLDVLAQLREMGLVS